MFTSLKENRNICVRRINVTVKIGIYLQKAPSETGMSLREYFECHFGHMRSNLKKSSGHKETAAFSGAVGKTVGGKSMSKNKDTAGVGTKRKIKSGESVQGVEKGGSNQRSKPAQHKPSGPETVSKVPTNQKVKKSKDLSMVNHVTAQSSNDADDSLIGACGSDVSTCNPSPCVEAETPRGCLEDYSIYSENELEMLKHRCLVDHIELVELPNPLSFPPDKLVPIFKVIFKSLDITLVS